MDKRIELKLLQEIESLPKPPSQKQFHCIDNIVKLTPELKAFLKALHINVERSISKDKLIEIYNMQGITSPVFFCVVDLRSKYDKKALKDWNKTTNN